MKMHQLQRMSHVLFTLSVFQIKVHGEVHSNCGRRLVNHEALIVNGYESKEGDWPWHASILHIDANLNIQYKCAGTLLDSNSILTAAHCVYENDRPLVPDRVLIHLGRHNLKLAGTYSQEIEVYQTFPHHMFNVSSLANDIAIIRLATKADLNDYVQPICLWDPNKEDLSSVVGKYGTVVGFGITENNQLSYVLRQATIPVVDLTTCLESDRSFFGHFLSDSTFCAGYTNGTTACNGDSGGSLTFEEDGVYRIRGIVSLTQVRPANQNRFCKTDQYVVFTDVAKYLNWIRAIVPAPGLPSTTASLTSAKETIDWAGFQWTLRDAKNSGPGPNDWKSTNVWIDSRNRLHLKLAYSPESGWSCAELYTNENFGFGTYRWFVEGAIDKFDPNVVLGLFNHGTADTTDAIALEMAKWGRTESVASNLFYTVYPRALNTAKPSSLGLRMVLQGTYTTHQFKWTEDYVSFRSQHGFQNLSTHNVFFTYQTPTTFTQHMPIGSVPLHMNLWAFKGNPPADGEEVEIVIHDFQYEKEVTKESQKFI